MKKEANIPKAFIGFLIASFLFWLLMNLSKKYETTVKYNVVYTDLAQNKMLQEEPTKEIELLVKATGFKLFADNFSNRKVKIVSNKLVRKSKNKYYLLVNNQQTEIQKQLRSGLKLQRVLQDTLYLKLGSLQTKKVPVIADLNITYQLGYDLAEAVKVTPDSVLVSGPELQLRKLSSIKTGTLLLENVSKNSMQEVELSLPENSDKIKISANKVAVSIVVDKFTEGELEIPVKIINLPKKTQLNIFPKKVKVIYKVGLKNFNKVVGSSFEVVCDYKEAKNNELSYLVPELKSKPEFVSSIRLEPSKIDFLIQN